MHFSPRNPNFRVIWIIFLCPVDFGLRWVYCISEVYCFIDPTPVWFHQVPNQCSPFVSAFLTKRLWRFRLYVKISVWTMLTSLGLAPTAPHQVNSSNSSLTSEYFLILQIFHLFSLVTRVLLAVKEKSSYFPTPQGRLFYSSNSFFIQSDRFIWKNCR